MQVNLKLKYKLTLRSINWVHYATCCSTASDDLSELTVAFGISNFLRAELHSCVLESALSAFGVTTSDAVVRFLLVDIDLLLGEVRLLGVELGLLRAS